MIDCKQSKMSNEEPVLLPTETHLVTTEIGSLKLVWPSVCLLGQCVKDSSPR